MDDIAADGIRVVFDPAGGLITDLAIDCEDGTRLRPLHKAPWTHEHQALPQSVPLVERKLAGDFFCAPFAATRPGVPLHGWAANGDWQNVPGFSPGGSVGRYVLRQDVEGAQLTKEIRLLSGHPLVYQTHTFTGGTGTIPIAHHAMLHVPGGARLSFSEKVFGRTGPTPPETDPTKGRSILAYPQQFASLEAVRRADDAVIDTRFYPFDQNHEDVLVLSERPDALIGWSAALAAKDGFVFFAIKDARTLPHTVLWMSNGGRYYSPWNGRHTAVIGIEEAAVGFHLPDASEGRYSISAGLSLAPGRVTQIRYAFGAIPVPKAWTCVSGILLSSDLVTLIDAGGDSRRVPFHGGFFSHTRASK